jgi:asparagine synthase (glutamine-hydrolysing)
MCGIAGIWNLNAEPIQTDLLDRFRDAISHRGPDGYGNYVDDEQQLGLAHRRLSIIDLSENGKQPMCYADGRYWITYNGEIFNFIELKAELESKGYTFRTDSDTEVVLAAYTCWGAKCLLKFNGMWGMAIWDRQEKTLFLARDRFGIKPLYYIHLPGKRFAFASETIAFKHLDGYKRCMDQANLSRSILDANSLIGAGYTIFQNIFQLLPSHYMEVRKDQLPVQKRWWSTAEHLVKVPASFNLQVEEFSGLLEDACRIRMRSDVPIATALSGGLDSSSVNCMIHYVMGRQTIKTRLAEDWKRSFISYVEGTDQDERRFAQEVVSYTGSKAIYVPCDYAKIIAGAEESARKFDDISNMPMGLISDLYGAIKQAGIKVSLDGHGVDEMLFGYPYMVKDAYRWALKEGNTDLGKDISETYLGMVAPEYKAQAEKDLAEILNTPGLSAGRQLLKSLLPNYLLDKIRRSNKNRNVRMKDCIRMMHGHVLLPLSKEKECFSNFNPLELSVYQGFHKGILQGILRNFDRASMQNQIEVRMPFLDWRLVRFVFSLPLESKLGGGYTKRILRDSMAGKMPEGIRARKLKTGFSAPMKDWFNSGMKQFVLDKIHSKSFLEAQAWDGQEIVRWSEAHYRNNSWTWEDCSLVWSCICADIISN